MGKVKNHKILLLIILSVVLLACITVLGYFLLNYKKNTITTKSPEPIKTSNIVVKTNNEIASLNDKMPKKTCINKIWGIQFQYPDNPDTFIIEDKSNINIQIYTNKKLNYSDHLYFIPVAINEENITNFENLKLYYDKKYPDIEKIIYKNRNGINFYKFTIDASNPETYYYSLYDGKKPFNAIAFYHRAFRDDFELYAKEENIKTFEEIIDNFNFIEIDEELAEKYFQDKGINPECSGWYAAKEYGAGNTLTKLTDIKDVSLDTNYTSYDDKNITFYYPKDWSVEYSEVQKRYKINYGEFLFLSISIRTTSDYIADYEECLGRCFEEENPISTFSWKSFYCSENYSLDNMNKVLTGHFIDFISTGSLPPNGTGGFYLKRTIGDKLITAGYSSENLESYPKAQEKFYQIVKSIKLK